MHSLLQYFDSRVWLPSVEGNVASSVYEDYDNLLSLVEEELKSLFKKWLETVPSVKSMRQPVLTRSTTRPVLLKCNIDE